MTPETQWHWEQGNKYAHEGIKVLLTLNGGAAIALLTFVGHGKLAIVPVGYGLLSFGIGALFAVIVFLSAYLTQLFYGKSNLVLAQRLHLATYALVLFSLLAFLAGLGFAYWSLPR